jgi:hypothetical protein
VGWRSQHLTWGWTLPGRTRSVSLATP